MPISVIPSKRIVVKPIKEPGIIAPVEARLAAHLAVLQTLGISGLQGLGTLRIGGTGGVGGTSAQTVVPRSGLLRPRTDVMDAASRGQFKRAFLWNRSLGQFESDLAAREARFLNAERFPSAAFALRLHPAAAIARTLKIEDCYWAATKIEIAANTTVLFQYPNIYLTVLCEELIVGDNVTFTWEFPPEPQGALRKLTPERGRPAVLRPAKPATPKKTGEGGEPGLPGIPSASFAGANGQDAPELELWTLKIDGAPIFFLNGQDGFAGAEGCDGGAGGDGAKGRNETKNLLGFCDLSAGRGGDGGKGGKSGDGTLGGSGGKGGQLFLYAPEPVLANYSRTGFNVSADGGRGGPGGASGLPGPGGNGGAPGDTTVCVPLPGYKGGPSTQGKDGAQGDRGAAGPAGSAGEGYASPFHFVTIDEKLYRRKLSDPAITGVTPAGSALFEGDTVTLEGLRLTATDSVLVDDVPAVTRFIDAGHLSFAVPAVAAGRRRVEVLRKDGARSNPAVLPVAARLTSPVAGTRLRPGITLELRGSGFAPDCEIRVNDSALPGFEYVDSHTIRCRLVRPPNVTRNAAGEHVELRVVFRENERTEALPLVLETFRIAVFGDSVLWGQGLADGDKIDALVEAGIRRKDGQIGVYRDNFAHSGAVIGFARSITPLPTPPLSALDGEIPTDYPTVFEQVALLTASPETVDLVLVNGGINDVNFRTILPSTDEADLKRRIETYCRNHMLQLLRRVTQTFSMARVIVSGYFQIVSEDSDPDPLTLAGFVQAVGGGVIDPGVPLPGLLAANCKIFAEHSEKCLQAAVDAINLELAAAGRVSPHRVTLVVPPFAARNAVFAPEPWLFAVKLDLALSPQDEIAQQRQQVCSIAPESRTNRWQCERASAGHPNKKGARAYAREILGALQAQSFPEDFLWGAATAAYQVEGGITNNDWHIFTTTKAIQDRARALGKAVNLTVELAPPGNAIGHGNIPQLREDLDRAVLLGMNAYRFSIEWSRVEPAPGRFDTKALEYYDRAIEAMLERGLKPLVTLNHLTLPDWVLTPPAKTDPLAVIGLGRAVEDDPFKDSLRGWESYDTLDAFERYVEKVVTRYHTQVDTWFTLNEPAGSMIGIGYLGGIWSPGFALDGHRAKQAYFNLLRAHVRAYDKIKEIYGADRSQVGFAHAMMFCKPSQNGRGLLNEHAHAREQFEYFINWHMLDSLTSGQVDTAIEYEASKRTLEPAINFFNLSGRRLWSPRLDFLGINYYRSTYVHAYAPQEALATAPLGVGFSGGKIDPDLARQPNDEEKPCNLLNDLGWEIYPRGLYDIIKEIDNRHDGRLPIMITENGMPENADRNRAAYTVAHLEQLARAVNEGSRILGYMHWTLVDNFEWQEGYRPEARFGLFTAERSSRGVKRHITEGALASQAAAKQNSVRGLAERFGRITPRGFAVSPPTHSPGALFHGTLPDGDDITLYFFRTGLDGIGIPGQMLGMMYARRSQAWTLLESVTVRRENLSFARKIDAATSELFTAVRNGSRLTGTVNGLAWSAERDAFFGTWHRNEPATLDSDPTHLHIRVLEGSDEDPRAKYLKGDLQARWCQAIASFPAASTLRMQFDDGGSFEGRLDSSGQLRGEIKLLASQVTPASWTRLPDGCGL